MSKALNNGNPGKTVYQFSVLFYGADGRPADIKHFKAREGEFLVVKTDWHDPSINYATAEDYKALGNFMPPSELLEKKYQDGKEEIRSCMRPRHFEDENGYAINTLSGMLEQVVGEVLQLHRRDFKNNADMHSFFTKLRDLARRGCDYCDSVRCKERADQRAASSLKKAFACHSDCKHYPDVVEPSDDIAMWPEPCQMCRRHELLRDEYSNGEEGKA